MRAFIENNMRHTNRFSLLNLHFVLALTTLLFCHQSTSLADETLADETLADVTRSTNVKGKDDTVAREVAQAARFVREQQENPNCQLSDVLALMKGKSLVARNWYLGLAQTIADRHPNQAAKELEQFLPRLSEDAMARFWAFEYLTSDHPELRKTLLASMLADPCLELRYEAVALGLAELPESADAKNVDRLHELLTAARLPSQVQQVARRLEQVGHPVDLLKHFGFLTSFNTIGPFDNRNQSGFNVVHPPEADYLHGKLHVEPISSTTNLDGKQNNAPTQRGSNTYVGKLGQVEWRRLTTDAADGSVDLNPPYNNEKGAIVYALASFPSAVEQACELRIGSPNALQVWLNGKRVISREVYHAASQIDQYVATVKLKRGPNSILVKVCQNEQTEDWAQDWTYQLRFTDRTGFAIRPSAH